MLNILIPALLSLNPIKIHVTNNQTIQKVESRDVTFGVKETVEELLSKGKSERRTFIFAMFLDVENNEVPLNRKSFSKALESSLKNSINSL